MAYKLSRPSIFRRLRKDFAWASYGRCHWLPRSRSRADADVRDPSRPDVACQRRDQLSRTCHRAALARRFFAGRRKAWKVVEPGQPFPISAGILGKICCRHLKALGGWRRGNRRRQPDRRLGGGRQQAVSAGPSHRLAPSASTIRTPLDRRSSEEYRTPPPSLS